MADEGNFPLSVTLDVDAANRAATSFDEMLKRLVSGQTALGNVAETVGKKSVDAFGAIKRSLMSTIDVQNSLLRGDKQVAESAEILDGLARRGIETTAAQRATVLSLVQVRNEQKQQLQALQAAEEREATILREIHAPMETYIADVRALNSLLDQGKISAQQYDSQLERIESTKSAQGAGLGASGGGGGIGAAIGQGAKALVPYAGAAGAAFAAKEGAEEVIHLADAYTELQNRVRQFTSSDEELTDVTKRLFEISDEARVDVEATGETYTRLSVSLNQAGFSTKTTLDTLETLSKAIVTTGSTAGQTKRTLLEFGEALATGELKGRQFQSILRNTPILVEELASGLGVTTKQFDEMSKKGELTTETLVKALSNASGTIEQKFKKITPTVAQELQVIKNDIEQVIGGAAQGLGPIFAQLVPVIKDVVTNVAPLVADIIKFTAQIEKPFFKEFVVITELSAKAFGLLEKVLGPVLELLGKAADLVGDVFDVAGKSISGFVDAIGDAVDGYPLYVRNFIDYSGKLKDAMAAAVPTGEQLAEQTADLTLALVSGDAAAARYIASLGGIKNAGKEASESQAEYQKQIAKLKEDVDAGSKAQAEYNEYAAKLTQIVADDPKYADRASAALAGYRRQHLATIDPQAALTQKIYEHVTALGAVTDAESAEALTLGYINDLLDQGVAARDINVVKLQEASDAEAKAIKAKKEHEKAAKAAAKEIKDFTSELFPEEKALKELADVTEFLDRKVEHHKLTMEQAADALDRYRHLHEQVLDPITAAARKLDEERATISATIVVLDKERELAGLTGQARETAIKRIVQQQQDELAAERTVDAAIQAGTLDVSKRTESIQRLIEKYKGLEIARALAEAPAGAGPDVLGKAPKPLPDLPSPPTAKYTASFTTYTKLLNESTGATVKFLRQLDYTFSEKTANEVGGALEDIGKHLGKASDLLTGTFTSALDKTEAEIVKFVTTGKHNFKDLAETVFEEVDAMLIKLLLLQGAKLLGIPGLSDVVGGAGPAGLPGHARGADFTVGGTQSGTDQTVVAFRATRGEHVSVRTPDQQRGSAAPAAAPRFNIVNVVDRNAILDLMRGPDGRDIFFNHIRVNQAKAKSLLR